jgi:hypothetical protein
MSSKVTATVQVTAQQTKARGSERSPGVSLPRAGRAVLTGSATGSYLAVTWRKSALMLVVTMLA